VRSLIRRLLAPAPRGIQRDTLPFELADGREIQIERVRNPRARRIKLSVDEGGARLTLPPRASLVASERFVIEHRAWLTRMMASDAEVATAPLCRDVTTALPLRGSVVSLQWQRGRYAKVHDAGDAVVFTAPEHASQASLQRALREFYESNARADIGRWMPRYLTTLPRPPQRLAFKRMTSQWGSLSPDGNVVLDLSLVLAQSSAFEYVLVHELCHLIHANHSRAFWREVETRFPAWRAERAYFRSDGRQLKASLRALLG
jgi:predicted metal-dependent hydrolase